MPKLNRLSAIGTTDHEPSATPLADPAPSGNAQIGAIMIDLGVIRLEQAERVLEMQRERGGRFGDVAVSLGFSTRPQLDMALALQRGAPVLLPDDRRQMGAGLRAVIDDVALSRAYTDARTQLELRWFGDDPERTALAVLGDAPGDGRTLATATLGLLLAMTGRRVLLIDTCIDAPRLAEVVGGVRPALGLADALARPESALRLPSSFESVELSVLAPNGAGLGADASASRGFASMLATLVGGWDAILVDTPALSLDRRALSVAVRCSGALVLARIGRTRVARLDELRRLLADSGVEAVGVLANRF